MTVAKNKGVIVVNMRENCDECKAERNGDRINESMDN